MAKRSNPGSMVVVITVAALAAVGVLAVQAANSAPPKQPAAAPAPSPSPGATAPPAPPPQPTPPADSGSGLRVVYSLGQQRVWLMDQNNTVVRTFTVVPGSVTPRVDKYNVKEKRPGTRTSNGLPIRNTVIFDYTSGNVGVGFSGTTFPLESFAPPSATATTSPHRSAAPTTGTSPSPSLRRNTGTGIRETDADGQALFDFVDIGTPIVVTS